MRQLYPETRHLNHRTEVRLTWHLPHLHHDNLEMLRARLKLLEKALDEIIEIADSHEDADAALITVANLAEAARKL